MSGNFKKILGEGTAILTEAGIEEPAVEASILMCHILGCNRAWLFVHSTDSPAASDVSRFRELIGLRSTGMPVQYLIGHQEFMSLDFCVNPSVLIPRQDTEILVEAMLEAGRELQRKNGRPPQILDIGTGSGCIAISIAHYLPESEITAADISEKALETAKYNASRIAGGERISFIKTDLYADIVGRRYDIIVSNPPYIIHKEIDYLQREVGGFEPRQALDGGEDGLDFYRRITEGAPDVLRKNGILAFEAGAGQAVDIAAMMDKKFTGIQIRKDLSGIDRVVFGQIKDYQVAG
jgi:release factor glutamine methyltransferase